MTDTESPPPPFEAALVRLMSHPSLSRVQTRHLLARLEAPRTQLLDRILRSLATGDESAQADAAFVLSAALQGEDRPWVQAVVANAQLPLEIRVLVRARWHDAYIRGQVPEELAEVDVPSDQAAAFWVQDAIKALGDVPLPLQRARVAAEMLVGDVPLADDALHQAVALLSDKLHVPPAQVYAELAVHPLTRTAWRQPAQAALAGSHAEARVVLENAQAALIDDGEGLKLAHALLAQLDAADPQAPVSHAWVSGADGGGGLVVLVWVHSATPRVLAVSMGLEPARVILRQAEGAKAEGVAGWAWLQAQPLGGGWYVPGPVAVALTQQALEQHTGKSAADAKAAVAALGALAEQAGWAPHALVRPAPSGEVNIDALEHPLCKRVEVQASDLPDRWKRELSKQMRARGRPRDDALAQASADVGQRKGVAARLAAALWQAATVAALTDAPAAGGIAAAATALEKPGSDHGKAIMRALVERALGLSKGPPPVESLHRDDVRDQVLPADGEPKGIHVLALDLAGAAWAALLELPGGTAGMDEDTALALCGAAGGRAAMAVGKPEPGTTEAVRLSDAAKAAIREHAESLPSRQRREMVDVWVKAWDELLTKACRTTCSQRCLEHLGEPRLDAAYSLDHPRLNLPWP